MNNLQKQLATIGITGSIALAASVVAPSEGLVKETYLDPVNILTACYGHTGPELKLGQKFTEEQCLNLLAKDLASAEKIVNNSVKVPLKDYQKAAFISFVYNVGAGKKGVKDGFVAIKSTGNPSKMLSKLNAGDYAGACNEFMNWTKANGKVLKGLVIRRQKEKDLCLGKLPEGYQSNAQK